MVVIWTERARERLKAVYDYYLEADGKRSARRITGKITDAAVKLSGQPRMGPAEPEMEKIQEGIRSLVAHKHYKILYRIESGMIYIVSVFDCRQNPEKMKEEAAK